jgi:hypothetical protein
MQAKRVADRAARRAYDAGKRAIDRLSKKSELDVTINDLKRKIDRVTKKVKPIVKKVMATSVATISALLGGDVDEINEFYRKQTGENRDIVSGGKKSITVTSLDTRGSRNRTKRRR